MRIAQKAIMMAKPAGKPDPKWDLEKMRIGAELSRMEYQTLPKTGNQGPKIITIPQASPPGRIQKSTPYQRQQQGE
jgi:hypothetical protein